ncbi:MAG: DUF2500 family protein [Oscillospiraceae bacterium]|nr:DUF2500 family protein [Oscillospiraceae bacterium]
MEWFSGIILVLAVLAIAAWPVTNALAKKKAAPPPEETSDIPQPEETEAVVKGKMIAKEDYGSPKVPNSVFFYRVEFELQGGENIFLDVPENVYEALQPGDAGQLLTQNGMFLDFDGRFGEDLPENTP